MRNISPGLKTRFSFYKRNNFNSGHSQRKLRPQMEKDHTQPRIKFRASYSSYQEAFKWIKDNKETIDTFIELLHIHPELIKHDILNKLRDYLRTIEIQSQGFSKTTCNKKSVLEDLSENIPTITITEDEVNVEKNVNKTSLLVIGKGLFERNYGTCSDLINELTNSFSVYCLGDEEILDGHNLVINTDTCLVMLSESMFHHNEILTLLQQLKYQNVPVSFVKSRSFTVSTVIKQKQRFTNHDHDRFNLSTLPLPPISRTPDHLTVDSSFVPDGNSPLLEGSKNAAIYGNGDILTCFSQICFQLKQNNTDSQTLRYENFASDIDPLLINETPSWKNESLCDDIKSNLNHEETRGASLIVMEHLTCNKPKFCDVSYKPFHQTVQNLPKISAWKTPPPSPLLGTKNILNKPQPTEKALQQMVHNLSKEKVPWLSDGPTNNTTYLLFSEKRGELPSKINWPEESQNIPNNDDCISEDSVSIGFQDIDFSACMLSCNSDDD